MAKLKMKDKRELAWTSKEREKIFGRWEVCQGAGIWVLRRPSRLILHNLSYLRDGLLKQCLDLQFGLSNA